MPHADVVIVGAGTLGLMLATRMIAAGKSVIVVEAGDRVASSAANPSTSESRGRTHFGTMSGRAVGLGGTSTLWGGQLAEFDPEDFDRSFAPWPLSHADIAPWYAEVYRRLGIGDLQPASFYRNRLGSEPEAGAGVEPEAGAGVERFFTAWLRQPNFTRLFRSEIVKDAALRVLLRATCNGVTFDDDRATRIRVDADGRNLEITGGTFVFALGTIATSRFFLSTARQGGVPWQHDQRIGTNFQDHLAGVVGRVSVSDEKRFRDYFENAVVDGIKLQPKLRVSAAVRAVEPDDLTGISGSFVYGSDLGEHLSNIKQLVRSLGSAASIGRLRQLPANLLAVGGSFAPLVMRYIRDRRVMAFFDSSLDFMVQCEQRPVSTSRVSIADGPVLADGLHRAVVEWQVDGREIERIASFSAGVDAYLERTGLGRLAIDPRVLAGDRSFIDGMTDTSHQCGGLPMGSCPATGIVDPDLKVFGTQNVYVASAAVFPSSSQANCTLTALALTERLGAHLE